MTSLHLVVPGQVIASTTSAISDTSANNEEESFLRGHGTYLEHVENPHTGLMEQRLVASVCGIVQRVNKLITVLPTASSLYVGQVGDLVVGRITSVGTKQWRVALSTGKEAQLPLTGIYLSGGAQRIRTAQDQRDMRHLYFREGDLVSAEVHKIQQDGTLVLHTRSTRYGKLENGTLVTVPPALIPRRKNHYMTNVVNALDVLWGTNGNIWIQRTLPAAATATAGDGATATNNDLQEQYRKEHAATPMMIEDRMAVARFRNAIECLRMVHAMITTEHAEEIYQASIRQKIRVADMLHPDTVIQLTACARK